MIYLDDLIIDVGVEDTRNKAGADALDLVGTRRAPRQHRALARLHCHHMHWLLGLQNSPVPVIVPPVPMPLTKTSTCSIITASAVSADSNFFAKMQRAGCLYVPWACVPVFVAAHQSC